ncbi:hypothetical protein [Botrimarina hoheduenensis]|uniref:Uncharacterized protein n=1 Tax=Botrimarina hoheduenensis TaxID=2528000 RepID=A0A5C5W9E3_9BACT|nr:hypothetical protein [Botrimarina hoheduenensis]TWT46649.1 hypothetical protein Pla111_17500 [Botrimarina hoheduenensis]
MSRTLILSLAVLAVGSSSWGQLVAESPDTPEKLPALGYRYGALSPAEQAALRPRFKLPLDQLAKAKTPRELAASVVIEPLPDPNRPLLPVAAAETKGDPFNGSAETGQEFDVLAELFAAEAADLAGSPSTPAPPLPASDDPFGEGAGLDTDFAPAGDDPIVEPDTSIDSQDDASGDDFDDLDPFAE